jgi:hypothetical protein
MIEAKKKKWENELLWPYTTHFNPVAFPERRLETSPHNLTAYLVLSRIYQSQSRVSYFFLRQPQMPFDVDL